jgi:hypothetical protein
VLMMAAGLVEAAIGVEAAGRELEDIAPPLSAQEAEREREGQDSWTIGRGERFIPNLRTGLTGRQVQDAMVRDPVTVLDDLPLERLVSDVFLVRRHGVYAVRNHVGQGHCCIEPECAGEAQQSGGSPSGKGAKKGSNHSTVPMSCRLWAAKWRQSHGVIAQCNSAPSIAP